MKERIDYEDLLILHNLHNFSHVAGLHPEQLDRLVVLGKLKKKLPRTKNTSSVVQTSDSPHWPFCSSRAKRRWKPKEQEIDCKWHDEQFSMNWPSATKNNWEEKNWQNFDNDLILNKTTFLYTKLIFLTT